MSLTWLLSSTLFFYFDGICHYFSNVLNLLTIYCVVYLMVVLAIYDVGKFGDQVITPMGTIQMLLDAFGLLLTIPLFVTLGVEWSWWNTLREIASVFITWWPLYLCSAFRQRLTTWHRQFLWVVLKTMQQVGESLLSTPYGWTGSFFTSNHLYLGVELALSLIFTIAVLVWDQVMLHSY